MEDFGRVSHSVITRSESDTKQPSTELLQALRWSYFAVVCIVFLLGCWNVVKYLVIEKRWKAFPLTLMYTVSQLLLIITMARLACPNQPNQPNIDINSESFRSYLYLQTFSLSLGISVGIAQILTLLELTLKTTKVTAGLKHVQLTQSREDTERATLHSDLIDDPMHQMRQDSTDHRFQQHSNPSDFAIRIQRIDKAIKVLYFVAIGLILFILVSSMIGTYIMENDQESNGLQEFVKIMKIQLPYGAAMLIIVTLVLISVNIYLIKLLCRYFRKAMRREIFYLIVI